MNVLGKDVSVRIYQGGWKFYACASSCSLTVSTSTVETSTTGSGTWATFAAQKNSWSGTLEGVVNLDQDLTLYHLRQLQIALTPINIQYERTDANGNSYTDTGTGIIVSSSDTGQMDSIATFSIEIQGTGALIQELDTFPEGDELLINEDDALLINDTDQFIL
jgi:predicted secreted protein